MSGDDKGVRVWRVEDGKQRAYMEMNDVDCLAVSKDGRWIGVGTWGSCLCVWDAARLERVLQHKGSIVDVNHGVDFSPDSTRLVSANYFTATIWDIPTGKRVQRLRHVGWVIAAKYASQGDRIATATRKGSVRVWNSGNGHLLADIPVTVVPEYNTGLLWLNDHLLVIANNLIKQFDVSTASVISEWLVPDTNIYSCIALSQDSKLCAYATNHIVTLFNTSTHSQLGFIKYPQAIRSIAFSPDHRFLAIGGEDGKINVDKLLLIIVSFVSRLSLARLSNNLHSGT